MIRLLFMGMLMLVSIPILCQINSLPTTHLFSGTPLIMDNEAKNIGIDFTFLKADKLYTSEAHREVLFSNGDSLYVNSSGRMQLSYCINDKVELGVEIPFLDAASTIVGKYLIYSKNKLNVGIQTGIGCHLE